MLVTNINQEQGSEENMFDEKCYEKWKWTKMTDKREKCPRNVLEMTFELLPLFLTTPLWCHSYSLSLFSLLNLNSWLFFLSFNISPSPSFSSLSSPPLLIVNLSYFIKIKFSVYVEERKWLWLNLLLFLLDLFLLISLFDSL